MSAVETFLPETAAPYAPGSRIRIKLPAVGAVDLASCRLEGQLTLSGITIALGGGTAARMSLPHGVPGMVRTVRVMDGHGKVLEEVRECNVLAAIMDSYGRSYASSGIDLAEELKGTLMETDLEPRFSIPLKSLGLGVSAIKDFPLVAAGGLVLEMILADAYTPFGQTMVNEIYTCTLDTANSLKVDLSRYPQFRKSGDVSAGPLHPGEKIRLLYRENAGGANHNMIREETIVSVDYSTPSPSVTLATPVPAPAGTILTSAVTTAGTGYTTDNVYPGVALTGGTGAGAIATITISGGACASAIITNPGSGYAATDTLGFAAGDVGGFTPGTAAVITVNTVADGTVSQLSFGVVDRDLIKPAATGAGAGITQFTLPNELAERYLYVGQGFYVAGKDSGTGFRIQVSTHITAIASGTPNATITVANTLTKSGAAATIDDILFSEYPVSSLDWVWQSLQITANVHEKPGRAYEIRSFENIRERIPAAIGGEINIMTGDKWEKALGVMAVPIDETTAISPWKGAQTRLRGLKDNFREYMWTVDGESSPLAPIDVQRVIPTEHFRSLANTLKQVLARELKISPEYWLFPKALSKLEQQMDCKSKRVALRWERTTTTNAKDLALNVFLGYVQKISY